MAEPTGLSAVLDRALGDRALLPEAAEQEELLDLGLRPVPGETIRPRGRPAGATNRRTERLAAYLLTRYPDPLEGLLRMGSLGIEEMRAALGCTPMEAFQEKRLCLIAALPYLHKRMPIAVDVSSQSVVHLAIHTEAPGGTGEGGDDPLLVLGHVLDAAPEPAEETESYQRVAEADDAPV